MGKQSSRIYYQGKDHKDIYMDRHYHSAIYLCKESKDGKVNCELVWRKIFDENLYIHRTLPSFGNAPVSQRTSLTVNMDEKKAYLSPVWTNRDNGENYIIYHPDWIGGKEYVSFLQHIGENAAIYKNKELIFNDVFQVNDQLLPSPFSISLHYGDYPSRAVWGNSVNLLTIKKIIMEDSEITIKTVSRDLINYINLQKYNAFLFNGYNNSKYIYMLAKSEGSCILIQSDLNGNIKSLKLENFDSRPDTLIDKNSPMILFAKGEKVYLLATKVIYDENTNTNFIINSITIVDGMKVVSTEAIDSWTEENHLFASIGELAASIYNPTVSPMTFVYSRYGVFEKDAKSLLITIDEDEISTGDISVDNFSFFVNLYEDGVIVDTITVSTKYNCTDMQNNIIWLFELSEYFLANVTTAGENIKTSGFNSIVHWTEDGWVDGGTHGVFYDESTQYFYTFYIKHLYPSGENFFIRFKI